MGGCGNERTLDVAAASNKMGSELPVTVSLPGGQLMVSWRGDAEPVWLTGNAELISEGKIDL